MRTIGVEGYSGSGKTTLARSLVEQIGGAEVFSVDDFTQEVDPRTFIIHEEPNAILEQYVKNQGIEELVRNVAAADAAQLIIIEGPFLLHEASVGHMIDRLIYIEADMKAADARRSRREGFHEPPIELRELSGYFKKAYSFYVKNYQIKDGADLVIPLYPYSG